MPNLGDFTAVMAEADPEPTTFTLHEEVFALQPELSAYAFLKFSALVGEIDITDEDQIGAINMVVMFDVLRDAIVPEDWDRFTTVVKENRVGVASLVALVAAIQGMATGRPTGAPSGSAGGASGTSRKSSAKRSKSSATKQRKKATTAARSGTARQIEEARRAEEMMTPTAADSAALAAALGLPVGTTGSTG